MNMNEAALLAVVVICWITALVRHSSALVNAMHKEQSEA